MWTEKQVENVVNLLQIAGQFDAEPDLPYHKLNPGEVISGIHWFSQARYAMSVQEQKVCELPAGWHRKERGRGGAYR
jgi:hypothetical protein